MDNNQAVSHSLSPHDLTSELGKRELHTINYTSMTTIADTLQCYTEGLINEAEMADKVTALRADAIAREAEKVLIRQKEFRAKWDEYIVETLKIQWQFKLDSEENKELANHITGIRRLITKASKNVK